MAWGVNRLGSGAWIALAFVCACLALSAPANAQNSASKDAPAKSEQPVKKESAPPSPNSAEKPAHNSADKPAKQDPPPGESADPAPSDPPQDDNGNSAEAPAPTGGTVGPALPPAVPPQVAPTQTSNAAEAKPPSPAPGAAPTSAPPPISGPAQPLSPNAAESRTTGTAAGNAAEAGHGQDESGIAEPPEPPFTLQSPDEIAGNSKGYKPPGITLDIPGMDAVPDQLPDSDFIEPGREYLKHRPLPGLDVTDTDQERMARNIEESLKQIDLTVETRPEGGIQIPLPSGLVTFKAAQAFQFDRRNRILTFTGNAEIIFGDIAVWADSIEVNDSAATAYAKGYVAVQQKDEIIYADEMYLNYDTKALELFYIEGNTSGPRIKGRAYYKANRAYGTFDRLIMEEAQITTCDPFCGTTEEYHLQAHKVVYKRNTSIVLHDVYIFIRRHKVGYIPLLAFPLPRNQRYEQQQSDVAQTYGYNSAEGFFAKFAYTYSTRYVDNVQQPLKGVIKLDMMTKRGAGVGIRQDFYTSVFGVTTVKAYYQQDWPQSIANGLFGRKLANAGKDVEFNLDQELNLSRYLTGAISVDRTNRFIPSNTLAGSGTRTNTWANNFNLNYQKNKTQAALTANQNINIAGGFTRPDGTLEPTNQTNTSHAGFNFNRDLGSGLKFQFDEQVNSTKGGSGREGLPADIEGSRSMSLDWTGEAKTKLQGYQAKLVYREPAIDLDHGRNLTDNNVSVNKEIPSLTITLPRDLLGDGAYFNDFRLEFNNLVTGRRSSPASIFRAKASVSGGDEIKFSRSSRLRTDLKFDQFWYDDGNAQYALRPNLTYSYDTFSWLKFNAGWNMNFRQGVREPPVASDRTTYSQTANYGFEFTNRRSWRGRLSGGYNINDARFSPISASLDWDPNKTFGLTATTTLNYVVDSQKKDAQGHTIPGRKRFKLSPVRLTGYTRSTYVDPEGFYNWFLAWGIDNDIEDGWNTTRLNTSYYRKYKRGWSSEIIGGYRQGTGPPIDSSWKFVKSYLKQISVRKTNCCTTFEGGWRASSHEFYLNMYLNALPQYPGLIDMYRYSTTSAEGTKYDYQPQFLFPINPMINDILQDQFGFSNPFGGGGFGGGLGGGSF